MKDFRFYADGGTEYEIPNSKEYGKRTRKFLKAMAERGEQINCVAVMLEKRRPVRTGGGHCEALAAVFGHANSGVNVCGVADDYLREKCTRIDEALARKLHPALFARLD
jgi:hypothetical protein